MGEAKVSASSVNVRSGPSTSKKWLGRLEKGETFSYSNDKNGWLQTVYNSQTAYVCKKYTTITSSETAPAPASTESSSSAPASTPSTSSSVSINVNAAVSYNKKRGYSKDKWKKIQNQIGATATGTPDEETAIAVAEWQQAKGLKVDGKCGPQTVGTMDLSASTATSTPAPTTTETPATTTTTPATTTTTTTPATTTTTETPATTTTTTTAPATKILSSKQVSSAIDYNNKQHLESIWTQIQALVGVAETGLVDEITVQAIAAWQKKNGLTADGKFGKKSLAKSGLSTSSSTTTPAPTTTTTTPEPTTTTPAPTTTTTPTVSVGEKLLSSKEVDAALDFSINNHLAIIWKQIQAAVGVEQTNIIDETSVQAIAVWQKNNGLKADGKFGKDCYTKTGLKKPSAGSVKYGEMGPGGLIHANNSFIKKNSTSGFTPKELVDLKTQKKFTISWSQPAKHSDVTPYDKASTDTIKNIVNPSKSPSDYDYWSKGSSWNWKGHPGALKLQEGLWVSCGFHLRPHGSVRGGNPDKPWDKYSPQERPEASKALKGDKVASENAWPPGGHFCLYYNKENGGGTDSCREAADLAKDMQCPEKV